MHKLIQVALVALFVLASGSVAAQSRWQARRAARAVHASGIVLPAGAVLLSGQHYGAGAEQTFDVYAPAGAHDAPVIFMVHGGGWRRGDKSARNVVQNKVAHWLPRGIIVVSVDYPMLPDVPPLQQAHEVAQALAVAQRQSTRWGGDPRAFVLMGHSAGAHLVSLISAEPSLATTQGALPWLGTVALDSAAFNVVSIMQSRHPRLYDEAFGSDRATWLAASPTLQLQAKIAPLLAVCSSRRADSCPQAQAFAVKAQGFGSRVEVLPEDLSHGEINAQLGLASAYTAKVDVFLASLGPPLTQRLR